MVGRVRKSLLFVGALLGAATAHAVPVIPGGVGFGMSTPAGRGGTVYRVTNVNASGAGSPDFGHGLAEVRCGAEKSCDANHACRGKNLPPGNRGHGGVGLQAGALASHIEGAACTPPALSPDLDLRHVSIDVYTANHP